ncbi:hypothetical protein E4T47_02543 [Aureobasidium subglaciale]|nr:hypothetical protein E4T43_02154 [Aureobasidium subglaciale]KAI5274425.1 hypothetical protein E4T47_02543 [Aureobasidium subglaciale]
MVDPALCLVIGRAFSPTPLVFRKRQPYRPWAAAFCAAALPSLNSLPCCLSGSALPPRNHMSFYIPNLRHKLFDRPSVLVLWYSFHVLETARFML